MQKTAAMADACGWWSLTSPAGMPVSLMHWVVALPKAPAFASVWPTAEQIRPSVAVFDAPATPEDWSAVADVLAARLQARPARDAHPSGRSSRDPGGQE